MLEIGAAGLEYGAGPHRCPGRELAERICASIVAEVARSGHVVRAEGVMLDADGRPTALQLAI